MRGVSLGAILLLEDGRVFEGEAFGCPTTKIGEVVFHTTMTGYQEVLTDPSFAEQVVVMTAPHIGNTGINLEDPESSRVWSCGFVVRSLSRAPSSWRSEGGLHQYLQKYGVPGIQGVDTRALVRHIRTHGAMKCAISTDNTPIEELKQRLRAWPGMVGRSLATEVCCDEAYVYHDPANPRLRITVVDGGVKTNILRLLRAKGVYIRVHPITDPPEAWIDGVDAVLFSNGPGDPAASKAVIASTQKAIAARPCVGICLGHQVLALALGATTYKLPFGHRGGNQPVQDQRTRKIQITSQNHGFAVDAASLTAVGAEVTHVHLNDQTVSGFSHADKGVYAVQYHPEGAPGPHDGEGLLEEFLQFVEARCR